MDLRSLNKRDKSGFNGYSIPASFELTGKSVAVIYGDGEKEQIDFAAAPRRELTTGNDRNYPYKCVKLGAERFFVSYADGDCCTSFVIDSGAKLVTRVKTDATAAASLSFGSTDPAGTGEPHNVTEDFAGNAFVWSLGAEPDYIVSAEYEAGSVSVSFPLMGGGAPDAAVSGFTAVRLAEGVYLQCAAVTVGGRVFQVALAADLNNMLCAGAVFGINNGEATHTIIGGYGCARKEDQELNRFNKYGRHAIVQFIPPPCYELTGKTLTFDMDDGCEFILDIMNDQRLTWSVDEILPASEDYTCLKADDSTYLISYEIGGLRPRANHTFIIDMENMLVTRIISTIGKNNRWPYLMATDIEFGAIRQKNVEYKSYPRHSRTTEMTGNVVEWAYGSEMSTTHIYHDAHFYRITYARSRAASLEEAREAYAFNNMAYNLPSSDEPTDYLRIKEGMYLVSLTERNCEKLLGPAVGFRSNTLCFLQNYKGGGYVAGRAFGTSTTDEGDVDTNIMIGAYGYFIGAADEELKDLLTSPNPYVV